MNVVSEEGILNLGRQVLIEEADEVRALADRLGEPFVKAVKLLLSCKGRVVVSGIGKSGHIVKSPRPWLLPEPPLSLCMPQKPRTATWE